jgi:hypothetical protein
MMAPQSKDTLGQQLMLRASSPSYNSTIVAGRLGSARAPRPMRTSAFGSSGPAVTTPRGR